MSVPLRALLSAVFALLAVLSSETLLAGVGEWTSGGPEGAAVEALAAHQSNPSTVYASTAQRLYKSVDAGASWAPTGMFGGLNLVLPTSDPSVVYATVTGSSNSPIYRTGDGGETWVHRAGLFGRISSLAEDGNHPMAIYAATSSGLFRTTNGGDAWEPVPSPASVAIAVTGVAIDPGDSRIIYAGLDVGNFSGVYRSSDRGATWTRTSLRDPVRKLLFVPGAPWDNDIPTLFALTSRGLQVTTNQGESWRRLAVGQPDVSYLAIDPTTPGRLYMISADVVLQSLDGGETVTPVLDGNFGQGLTAIVASGSPVVLVSSERGVSRSEDAGGLWGPANHGIREVLVHSLAIDPTNPAVVFAGSEGGIYESRDGGGTWNEPVPGSPGSNVLAIDPTDRSTIYAAGQEVFKSTNGGETWQDKSPAAIADSIAALVIDPNNPRRVFASNEQVFRSLNGADSWNTVMVAAEDDVASYYYPAVASALAIAPSDSDIVYAGGWTHDYANGFVSRSDDGGAGWSRRSVLDSVVSALVVDPCDPRIVYAGAYQGVFRSADGGVTWSGPGLPGISVSSLVLDPRHSSSVFAGTTSGLFWTNDSGASWTRFEPFLVTPIVSLAIDSSGRFLHAATSAGVFDLERTFEPCALGGNRLCLLGGRFELEVTARNPRSGTGEEIEGHAVSDGDRFGYFSFPALTGQTDFPEVIVKMRDATGLPAPYGGSVWVFHTALTDLDYTLTVRDTPTGRVRTYLSHKTGLPSEVACGEADTRAFAGVCTAQTLSAPTSDAGLVDVSDPVLTLLGGRFRATLSATDPRTGRIAEGQAIPRADAFGYFSLPGFTGDPSFPEVLVKMTDATALPGGRFWVFHTGLTDVEYTLTVTDQVTGAVRTYLRAAPDGTALCGEADTSAFR